MTETVVVFCTVPDAGKAADIARSLVEARLAPCANIVPGVRSIYTWKGRLFDENEVLMVLKTRRSLVPRLREAIVSMHPYEVPEIIALELADVHPPYLQWLLENTDDQ